MRKNKFFAAGIIIIAAATILDRLIGLPEFVAGFAYGIGSAFELLGVYSMRRSISKFRAVKIAFLKKILAG